MKAFSQHRRLFTAMLALAVALAVPLESSATPDRWFNEGNEAYSQESYEEAIELYRLCLEEAESAALHYNLANAYFQTGDIGRAVLHYEKALALDPHNPDAERNLAFLRDAAELTAPAPGLITRFALLLPLDIWSWTAAGAFWLACAFLLLPRLFEGATLLTRAFCALCLVVLLTCGLGLAGFHAKAQEGVILEDDTPLLVAPSPQSNEYGFILAGEVAVIQKSHQGYAFVATADGRTGWLTASKIERIWE